MSQTEALASFAVKTYRYLRWSIVVVVLSMIASVLLERVRVGCFEGSLSGYYYTPTRAVFVGGLVAIGVSLIALKGSTDWEDVLLNLAGVLAPIVAFVPTTAPTATCSGVDVIADSEQYIDNNVLAYAIGGLAALVIAFVVARLTSKPTLQEIDAQSLVVLGAGALILVVGLVWYGFFRESFLERAQMGAAISMFSVVAVVIFLNGYSRKRKRKSWLPYICLAAAMPLSAAALAAGKWINEDWDHFILWLELVEMGAFGAYWILQTFEHWNGGTPTGPERQLTYEAV